MRRGYKNEILLGLFFILVAGLLIYMFHVVGGRTMSDKLEITGIFPTAAGLVKDNFVMVAGVPVGSVKKIEVEFDKAKITMLIDKKSQIRNDASARIRSKNLLGEKYIELVPKSQDAPLLKKGDRIESGESPFEIDEIFTTLRPFFKKLNPMAPKISSILTEIDELLKKLNKTGENKKDTIEKIIDKTEELLAKATDIIEKNDAKLNRSITNMDKLLKMANTKAPKLLDQADKTLLKIEEVANAVPVDTLQKIPQSYAKIEQAIDNVLPMVERLDKSSERIDVILKNLDIILQRVVKIDELTVRRFLQEEGVNINLTQDSGSKERIEKLEKEKSKD